MPIGQICVREATRDDLQALVGYQLAMASETEGQALDRGVLRDGIASMFSSQEKGFYMVAEADGRVVGGLGITYEWSDWRNSAFWWIQSVYVESRWRRKGVYTAMHSRVLELARSRGDVCGIRLYVERTNLVAKKTYEYLGMAPSHYDMFEVDFDS
jgi:GNAT superfamily N-acetyltransferase